MRRLGAGPLADADRVPEQQVERRPGPALGLCELPCLADLAEDLGSRRDGRVEPGGDLEQVPDGGLVVLAVQVRVELVGREVAELAEEVADVGVGTVEPLGDGVDLGAVARAEHDDLADVVAVGEPVDRLGELVGGERHPLEHAERARAVVDADDDDGHDSASLDAAAPAAAFGGDRGGMGRSRRGDSALLVVAQDLQLDGEVDLAHRRSAGHRRARPGRS